MTPEEVTLRLPDLEATAFAMIPLTSQPASGTLFARAASTVGYGDEKMPVTTPTSSTAFKGPASGSTVYAANPAETPGVGNAVAEPAPMV